MIRPAISSEESPLYDQATAITGTRMFGKMSTGIRSVASTPRIRMAMAMTTKVSGRDRAVRTIPIKARAPSTSATSVQEKEAGG